MTYLCETLLYKQVPQALPLSSTIDDAGWWRSRGGGGWKEEGGEQVVVLIDTFDDESHIPLKNLHGEREKEGGMRDKGQKGSSSKGWDRGDEDAI